MEGNGRQIMKICIWTGITSMKLNKTIELMYVIRLSGLSKVKKRQKFVQTM